MKDGKDIGVAAALVIAVAGTVGMLYDKTSTPATSAAAPVPVPVASPTPPPPPPSPSPSPVQHAVTHVVTRAASGNPLSGWEMTLIIVVIAILIAGVYVVAITHRPAQQEDSAS